MTAPAAVSPVARSLAAGPDMGVAYRAPPTAQKNATLSAP